MWDFEVSNFQSEQILRAIAAGSKMSLKGDGVDLDLPINGKEKMLDFVRVLPIQSQRSEERR